MIAYAMFLGKKHIILNGVGTTDSAIHMHMHRDIMYWIGAARFFGVKVTIEGPSCYHPPAEMYGFEAMRLEELHAVRMEVSPRYAASATRRKIKPVVFSPVREP
jgi:hypothetical protein